jgi:hypothetical protein
MPTGIVERVVGQLMTILGVVIWHLFYWLASLATVLGFGLSHLFA